MTTAKSATLRRTIRGWRLEATWLKISAYSYPLGLIHALWLDKGWLPSHKESFTEMGE